MKKELIKKEEPKPIQEYKIEDAKSYILNISTSTDTRATLQKFANQYLPLIQAGTISKEQEEKMIKEIVEISQSLGVETGFSLMNSVNDENYGLANELKRNLEKEFNCNSYSEKMLVDLMANSYMRKLTYSKRMDNNQKYVGHQYDSYRNYLSKEIDRAHRQFISAIETLKFMKQPSMRVNIKTNNAFVGENQQFNNNGKNNETK